MAQADSHLRALGLGCGREREEDDCSAVTGCEWCPMSSGNKGRKYGGKCITTGESRDECEGDDTVTVPPSTPVTDPTTPVTDPPTTPVTDPTTPVTDPPSTPTVATTPSTTNGPPKACGGQDTFLECGAANCEWCPMNKGRKGKQFGGKCITPGESRADCLDG
eukprot:CAMPEP_0172449714 /NCGR_PEP_ID=MMETSP1065-20121228/8344_1 /TAXON_ID=265537 /ORGANISM="Amphiprora paludosa, Strain CCMP125" /LENGTH=162 /DNA_ID=CAMNT_0013201437 /DNA_START=313 /DNA_END=801 /DNA_ORIENTATION=+